MDQVGVAQVVQTCKQLIVYSLCLSMATHYTGVTSYESDAHQQTVRTLAAGLCAHVMLFGAPLQQTYVEASTQLATCTSTCYS